MVNNVLGDGVKVVSNVEDLFDNVDAEFIRLAYLTLLGREPDSVGFKYYIDRLSQGISRVQVLDQICRSQEMTSERLALPGLQEMLAQWRRSRWPIIGGCFSAPRLAHEANTRMRLARLEASLRSAEEAIATRMSGMERQLQQLTELLVEVRDRSRALPEPSTAARPKPLLGKKGQSFVLNLSTSHHWRAHPVGIVRVERELAKYLSDFGNVNFVLWDSTEKIMRLLGSAHVNAILSERWCDSSDTSVVHFTHAALAPFKPSAGSICVSLGLDWDLSPVHEMVKYLDMSRAKFVGACYDLVPILFPEFTARQGMDQVFRRHFVDMGHKAASIFAISDTSRQDLVKFWREAEMEITLPTVEVIPLGAMERVAQLPELTAKEVDTLRHILIGGNYILYVSSLEARKNHRMLVNVWRELYRERGKACPQLIFVGMNGWGVDDLRQQIGRMPVFKDDAKIVWLNGVSDALLAHLYANCSFTVFPSLYEGWGLAAAESMSYGKACVISNNSSLQQATQGLMPAYHPGDYFGWKAEISRLIDDSEYKENLEKKIEGRYRQRTWADFSRDFCEKLLVGK
ncbi:MAG: glycosyltransferase [Burkholderia gladioli]